MKYLLNTFLLCLWCFSGSYAQTVSASDLVVGGPAPEFSLPFATRDSVGVGNISLSQYSGKKNVVLAFYPADWSGGCTREVCTLRDNFEALDSLDAEILGISGDSPYTHHEWAKHHNLPFLLLSDMKHTVAPAYRSYNPSSGYNKRTVFIVDQGGNIAYMDLEYSTKDLTSFGKLRDALSAIKP